MTTPIVTENPQPPEPAVPDPFVTDTAVAQPLANPPKRRRIWD